MGQWEKNITKKQHNIRCIYISLYTFPSGVSVQITEKVSRSTRGFKLHNSSHSNRGNMGITWRVTRQTLRAENLSHSLNDAPEIEN